MYETFGWNTRDIEDGFGRSLTGGSKRIGLDLDRLEAVVTHALRGNHTLTRVVRWKVFGKRLGMWSPTNFSVLVW